MLAIRRGRAAVAVRVRRGEFRVDMEEGFQLGHTGCGVRGAVPRGRDVELHESVTSLPRNGIKAARHYQDAERGDLFASRRLSAAENRLFPKNPP